LTGEVVGDVNEPEAEAWRAFAGARQVRTFGAVTGGLLELADWLTASGVSQVAMETTGVARDRPAPQQTESSGPRPAGVER
jgi:hypothetical protein